jgi:hypothetical protein
MWKNLFPGKGQTTKHIWNRHQIIKVPKVILSIIGRGGDSLWVEAKIKQKLQVSPYNRKK